MKFINYLIKSEISPHTDLLTPLSLFDERYNSIAGQNLSFDEPEPLPSDPFFGINIIDINNIDEMVLEYNNFVEQYSNLKVIVTDNNGVVAKNDILIVVWDNSYFLLNESDRINLNIGVATITNFNTLDMRLHDINIFSNSYSRSSHEFSYRDNLLWHLGSPNPPFISQNHPIEIARDRHNFSNIYKVGRCDYLRDIIKFYDVTYYDKTTSTLYRINFDMIKIESERNLVFKIDVNSIIFNLYNL